MSVQIPQGRAEAINRLGTYLTTRQRNKDKEKETSKTLHAIYRKDDRKKDHKISKKFKDPLCLQPASPRTKNAGKSLKGSRVLFFVLCEMPLLITTKLKDRGEVIWHFFLSLGIGWNFVLFLKLWGGGRRYVRTHMPTLLYTILYHGYGFPSSLHFCRSEQRKVLAWLGGLFSGRGGAAARWISSWLHPTKEHTRVCETSK